MKLQQYLGGLENVGPVSTEKRVFVEEWEKQLFGVHMCMMGTGIWAWPHLRVKAEGMNPLDYFKYRYYIKWLGGMCAFLIERNYINEEELDELTDYYLENPDAPLPEKGNPKVTQAVVDYMYTGDDPYRDVANNPVFKIGQRVRVLDPPSAVHTRLIGYLRNQVGVIDEVYPKAVLYSDSVPTDSISVPQPIYRVKFMTREIWPERPDTSDSLFSEVFESYLEAA
ncbi:nitrile hydratase subunit beta [Maritimibacter sp. 55A14]|uniref:nitrile hydratase subunit beta n=1 Tax=Maritimibacter sp. 55A14 TaxID=2174844 RepID=UPI000D60DC1B|nr:nitrile hydratase subunit beta [Maritimibacter sp. 55A14]PWE28822.1 nitrile hydratase subunit beta [Maritimibacter sp. 55A14]